MQVGTVAGLWRFPVKSMAGEQLQRAFLSRVGIPGDRGWAVFDEARGGITTAKRIPMLRACRARFADEPVPGAPVPAASITVPGAGEVRSDAADAAQVLSAFLERAVSLRGLGVAGGEAAPRVTLEGDPPDMLQRLNGLLPGEPLPDMSAFPIERLRQMRQGNFFDAFPLHLLTRATLRTLGALAPESDWDVRRFRCNVLVDSASADAYPDLEWIGRRLRLGGATLEVAAGCPRCVMVTQAVDDLPQDHRIMRTLVRETKHTAGVYARVVEEGFVSEGDAIVVMEPAPAPGKAPAA